MGRKREYQVNFRVSEAEFEKLQMLVEKSGLSMAEYMRRKALTGKGIIVQDRKAILKLIEEVHRIGNNINQIARVANGTNSCKQSDILALLAWQQEIYRALKSVKFPDQQ